jgi:hypothetical protein
MATPDLTPRDLADARTIGLRLADEVERLREAGQAIQHSRRELQDEVERLRFDLDGFRRIIEKYEADTYRIVRELEQSREALQLGKILLDAYIEASVNDEEGLLATVDQWEWASCWQRVDEAAQAFGAALSSAPVTEGAAE